MWTSWGTVSLDRIMWDTELTCYLLWPRVYYSVRPKDSYLHAVFSSICNRDQGFWSAKNVLNRLIIPSEAVEPKGQGQIAAVCSWSIDFSSSLSLDRPPKGASITWFPVANASTCTPCKTKVPVRQDSSCFCGLIYMITSQTVSVSSLDLLQAY